VNSCPKQGFVGVHIADAGNEFLVAEQSLYRRLAFAQAPG